LDEGPSSRLNLLRAFHHRANPPDLGEGALDDMPTSEVR